MSQSPAGFDPEREKAITEQAVEEVAASAEPAARREGIALCLSGGGFRAALFHLGAVRRLDELGLLARLDAISSVSGGSIFSGFLATCLRQRFGPDGIPSTHSGPIFTDWQKQVADPFHAFVSRDARTGPLLARLWPSNWFASATSVRSLAALYASRLTPLRLAEFELPTRPRFILCATDMIFGVSWVFERDRMGDWQAGYVNPPADWPLARAVAASSCFPPLFPPLPLKLPASAYIGGSYRGPDRTSLLRQLSLTDGGVYDNLGLEPVWKRQATVLVSDGGARFGFEWASSPWSRIMAYSNILQKQVGALRLRWLHASFAKQVFQGTYWGLTSPGDKGRPPGTCYSATLTRDRIDTIRTDLNVFTEAEIRVLENHGYLQAASAIDAAALAFQPEAGQAGSVVALRVPYPEWMDEKRVAVALQDSHQRFSLLRCYLRLFGRR